MLHICEFVFRNSEQPLDFTKTFLTYAKVLIFASMSIPALGIVGQLCRGICADHFPWSKGVAKMDQQRRRTRKPDPLLPSAAGSEAARTVVQVRRGGRRAGNKSLKSG
jgi:hypothetical protein